MTTALTLTSVLTELESVSRDFGYPVDWACSIIEARLKSKFEEQGEEDNVLEFHVAQPVLARREREGRDERRS